MEVSIVELSHWSVDVVVAVVIGFSTYSANNKLCCLSKGFVEIDETEAVERMQTLILIENQG